MTAALETAGAKYNKKKQTCEKTETLPSVSSDQSSPTTFSTRKVRLCRLRRTCSLAGYWQRETGSVCEREGSVKLFVCVYMWQLYWQGDRMRKEYGLYVLSLSRRMLLEKKKTSNGMQDLNIQYIFPQLLPLFFTFVNFLTTSGM